ncbi:MAG: MarR family transcriptional regulator [Candidatus Methanomethylophilaceae archaeon]|nr:MarR family transcriptional regulator [Candidatus Methanomethylophilaceae archaeon]
MAAARSRKGRQVMTVIETNGRCTAKEICDSLGMEPREVSGILKGLRLRGLVRIAETRSHSGNVWALN